MGQRMADLLTQLTAQNQAIVQSMQRQQQQQQFNAADIYGDDVVSSTMVTTARSSMCQGCSTWRLASDVAASTPAPPTIGTSGDGLLRDGEDDRGTAAPAAELPSRQPRPPQRLSCPRRQPRLPQRLSCPSRQPRPPPAAELPAPSAAAVPAAELPAVMRNDHCPLEREADEQ